LNSFRFLEKAIEFEARRQIELIEDGGRVTQETRLYDPDRGETRTMRTKEEAHDYRYFPDPDLLPLEISPAWIEEIRAAMPALPRELRARFEKEYHLSVYDAALLTESREKAGFFEAALLAAGGSPKVVANWVNGELSALMNEMDVDFGGLAVSAQQLGDLVARIHDGKISTKAGKEVL